MKKKIILLRGLPGSGKSTIAKKFLDEHPVDYVRISRDDIRRMLSPIWSQDIEAIVYTIKSSAISNALQRNYNIIVDECHSKLKIEDYYGYATKYNADIEIWNVRRDVEQCVAQNNQREGVAKLDPVYIRELNERFNWSKINFKDINVTYKEL